MSGHWWNPINGMVELTFRPVEGGFLYRAPSRWLFGRYQHYLVNAEQKARLASAHRTMMLQMFFAIIIGAATVAPVAGAFFPARSSTLELAYLGACALVGIAIGLILNALLLRKVNPIIATLTPSRDWITRRDTFSAQATTFPRGFVLFFVVLSFAMLALSAARPIFDPAGRDLLAVVGVTLFGFTTVYWSAVYIAKWRRRVE